MKKLYLGALPWQPNQKEECKRNISWEATVDGESGGKNFKHNVSENVY